MLSDQARVIQTLFKIQNKEGKTVDFNLNESQLAYDLVKTKRDLIVKARQKGFSSFRVAEQVVKCLGVQGTRAVLISHEAGATQRLLDKAQFILKHLKGPKAQLGRHSRNELYFPKTEATYYIGTAGARAFGRGDTITDLHISEYAWWETDGLKHVAGLMQAVPMTGTVCIESTGNGRANDFYFMCKNYKKLGYNLFFRGWWEDKEYSLIPEQEWQPEGFEHYFQDMKTTLNLTPEQLYWYWTKLLEFRLNLKTMQQEYPSTPEEAFQATGGGVFDEIPFEKSKNWTWGVVAEQRVNYLPGHPKPQYNYVIGADPSGGTGNDDAGVHVICLETLEQVLSFNNNSVDPVDLGHFLAKLGKKFNEAWIVCEANNHGIATLSILKKEYTTLKLYKRRIPTGKISKPLYGITTTESSKHELVGATKEIFEMGLKLYDPKTNEELEGFIEDPETKKMYGVSDNLVIALGMACIGVKKYYPYRYIVPIPEVQKKYAPGSFSITMQDCLDNLEERKQKLKAFEVQVNQN